MVSTIKVISGDNDLTQPIQERDSNIECREGTCAGAGVRLLLRFPY